MREGKHHVRAIAHQVLWLPVAAVLLLGCRPHAPRSPAQHDEILALWTQIRAWRDEAGLAADPSCATLMSFAPTDEHLPGGCAQPKHTSLDACGLGDAICDNAEQICIISGELDDNLWAHDKCTSATASCRELQQLCTRVAL
jgi:hypothetical protein